MNTLLWRTEPCVCVCVCVCARVAKTIYRRRRDRMKSTHNILPFVRRYITRSRQSLLYRSHSRNSEATKSTRNDNWKYDLRIYSAANAVTAENIACLLFLCTHNALVMDWCAAPPRRDAAICITSKEPVGYEFSPVIESYVRVHKYSKINLVLFLN